MHIIALGSVQACELNVVTTDLKWKQSVWKTTAYMLFKVYSVVL